MIEIEKYPCNDSNEAGKRERYWYELNHATLNTLYPGRTHAEYVEANHEYILLKSKQYHIEHKEQINEWRKTKIQCECGGHYCNNGKAKHLKTLKHKIYINSI